MSRISRSFLQCLIGVNSMNNALITILSLSVSGSILALMLLAGKLFLKNRVSKAFSYYIWLLVLLRLAIPVAAPVNLMGSLFNIEQPNVNSAVTEPTGMVAGNGDAQANEKTAVASNMPAVPSEVQNNKAAGTPKPFSLIHLINNKLFLIWLTGAAISLGWFMIAYAYFSWRVRSSCVTAHSDDLAVFRHMCKDKHIRMACSSYVDTPIFTGVLRPVILLPQFAYVRNGMDKELMNILYHELTHYRRKDVLYKWLVVVVTSFHWFNPLMLLIRREIGRACELSCDEMVISGMPAAEKQSYGNTLLALSAKRRLSTGILYTTLCENKKELKERLISIMKYKRKSIWVAALTLFLTLFLTGCAAMLGAVNNTSPKTMSTVSSKEPSKTAESSKQLKSVLAKHTANKILFFQSFTIGENQTAAFALAGGDVWYITASDAQNLKSDIAFSPENQSDAPVIWTVDDSIIFKCESIPGGSSSESYAWYVKDGKPVELPYTGMQLSYIGNGQFTTIGEAFDLNYTDGVGAGHTYKLYYLYWASDGLKEYGGLKINQKQLLKMKGAQAIIDAITKSGHTVDEIYYRANNIININYHFGDKQNGSFDNVTLIYRNNTVTPQLVGAEESSSKTERLTESNLSDYSYGGIYQKAFFPDIATYSNK